VIGIRAIGSYVPPDRVDNHARLAEFGMERAFLTDKIGIDTVSRRARGEDTADLCVQAFAKLQTDAGMDSSKVDCAVVCTQNPDGRGLPHTSAILHGRLNWPAHAACWDISLGCTGFVHGLSILQSFMAAQSLQNGLLFTADPYSKIIDPGDRNTSLLFGDGATVTWLSQADEMNLFIPVASCFHTEGSRGGALENRDGKLHMDGRAVFNFSATVVSIFFCCTRAANISSTRSVSAWVSTKRACRSAWPSTATSSRPRFPSCCTNILRGPTYRGSSLAVLG
jgi:3-oxoacyl-[acyl-carrier-protein] synthase-3